LITILTHNIYPPFPFPNYNRIENVLRRSTDSYHVVVVFLPRTKKYDFISRLR